RGRGGWPAPGPAASRSLSPTPTTSAPSSPPCPSGSGGSGPRGRCATLRLSLIACASLQGGEPMQARFPQEAVLRAGRPALIRPFTQHDTEALYAFFQRLPITIRRFAWDRIDSRALVETWGRELDYDKVLPLLALDGTRIVADATLHRREG